MNKILHFKKPDETYRSLLSCSPKVDQLFIKGKFPELLDDINHKIRVGIVGTRDATLAGLNDARRLAQVVSKHGGIVVSGMALGIDGAAHQGALDITGKTIAVLGSGVDIIYPNRHTQLSREIENRGCIISEFNCGTKALPWHFPIRNRIIAALCEVLVVPEGTLKGGARITVDLALAMGKTVCAIPGPRRNRASELPNSIIKDGAVCITDPSDVLNEMGIDCENVGWELESKTTKALDLDSKPKEILQQLAHKPLSTFEISNICNFSQSETTALLISLEQHGHVRFQRGMYEIC